MKYTERAIVLAALAALTLIGFFYFPGHTWLQSDSQIYIPIFEHLDDPSLLTKDPVAIRPHVTWTIYDETARAIHALTGFEYRDILAGHNGARFIIRFLTTCKAEQMNLVVTRGQLAVGAYRDGHRQFGVAPDDDIHRVARTDMVVIVG